MAFVDTAPPLGSFLVGGFVKAMAPDGAGGWFLGGTFNRVGGQARGGLAHIAADGTLDPVWAPVAEAPG